MSDFQLNSAEGSKKQNNILMSSDTIIAESKCNSEEQTLAKCKPNFKKHRRQSNKLKKQVRTPEKSQTKWAKCNIPSKYGESEYSRIVKDIKLWIQEARLVSSRITFTK